jgi:hypothetical protein
MSYKNYMYLLFWLAIANKISVPIWHKFIKSIEENKRENHEKEEKLKEPHAENKKLNLLEQDQKAILFQVVLLALQFFLITIYYFYNL